MAGELLTQTSLSVEDNSFPLRPSSTGAWVRSSKSHSASPMATGRPPPNTDTRDACATEKRCAVCQEEASGMYFGALVCLPCKSFFIRSTKDGLPRFMCLVTGTCDVMHGNRLRCQYCRFQKCLTVGMCRKEKPEIVQPTEGQVLCRVCHDIANGVHFGVPTCEGCKKFFRRALKESTSYFCKFEKTCPVNPRNRNSCRYCRYNMCISVGMSRNAIRMGRPKKMGIKDSVHLYGMLPIRQSSIENTSSSNRSCSPSSWFAPVTSSTRSAFPTQSLLPQSPVTSSTGTVIKIHGCPKPANCANVTPRPPGMIYANSSTGKSENMRLSTPMMAGQSVIRRCGKPASQHIIPVGNAMAVCGGIRQRVLAHSSMMSSSASLHSNPQSCYPSPMNTTTFSTRGGHLSSPVHSRSLSSSPHSDMSSSFSSVGDSKDALMDIEDDLADILSTLSQYNPAPVITTITTNSDFCHSTSYATSGSITNLTVTGSGRTDQSSHPLVLLHPLKQEGEFQLSCQFGTYSPPVSHTSRPSLTRVNYFQPDNTAMLAANFAMTGNALTSQASPPPMPLQHLKQEDEFQLSYQFSSNSPPIANTSYPEPTRFTHLHPEGAVVLPVKHEADFNSSSNVMPEPQHNSHTSPCFTHAYQQPKAEKSEWTAPPSNLFSQMYNSLLLTYNVGALGDNSAEEAHYSHHHATHQHALAALGSHGASSNTLTPVYI